MRLDNTRPARRRAAARLRAAGRLRATNRLRAAARPGRFAGFAARAGAVATLLVLLTGCSRESSRIAIDTQRRADQVQQAVFDNQHAALTVLLYRDALRRLAAGAALTPEQRAALNEVWNERDLVEFWALQHERARALRLLGVDQKLFAEQATPDLLVKSLQRKERRAAAAGAGELGRALGEGVVPPAEGDGE